MKVLGVKDSGWDQNGLWRRPKCTSAPFADACHFQALSCPTVERKGLKVRENTLAAIMKVTEDAGCVV